MTEQEWEDKLAEVQKHSENWYEKFNETKQHLLVVTDQLTEAKEIIREFIDNVERYSINNEILDKAEAFVNKE